MLSVQQYRSSKAQYNKYLFFSAIFPMIQSTISYAPSTPHDGITNLFSLHPSPAANYYTKIFNSKIPACRIPLLASSPCIAVSSHLQDRTGLFYRNATYKLNKHSLHSPTDTNMQAIGGSGDGIICSMGFQGI